MSDWQNEVIVNETDKLARQFHDSYEELAPLYGYTTRNDTRVFDPESPNGRLMRAVCLQVVRPIIADRNSLQDQRDFCMGEIERLRKESDEAREALQRITECDMRRSKFIARTALEKH